MAPYHELCSGGCLSVPTGLKTAGRIGAGPCLQREQDKIHVLFSAGAGFCDVSCVWRAMPREYTACYSRSNASGCMLGQCTHYRIFLFHSKVHLPAACCGAFQKGIGQLLPYCSGKSWPNPSDVADSNHNGGYSRWSTQVTRPAMLGRCSPRGRYCSGRAGFSERRMNR